MNLSPGRIGEAGFVVLLMVCYVLAGLFGIAAHQDPAEMDTTAYLGSALEISQTGGILNHVPNCFSGVYLEATQHPLYLLYLSVFAEPNVHFFVKAKFATFAVGFCFLLIFFFSVRRLLGRAAAVIASCLVVSSATFLHLSTMVACESFFALFFILFWCFAALGFGQRRYWPAAGFFAAMAFLTKSIGILLLPVFVLAVLTRSRGKIRSVLSDKYFVGFFLLFFIPTVPLCARNLKVYGTPFYNNSSITMWIDQWHDYYKPATKENPPTLGSYLKTHSVGNIARTFVAGLFSRDPRMITDGLKPLAFWEKPIRPETLRGYHERTVSWEEGWALGLVCLCVWGMWRRRVTPEAALAAWACVVFLIFVGWYSKVFPGVPPTRLLFPVLFFVPVFAAPVFRDTVWAVWSRCVPRISPAVPASVLTGIFLLVYLGSLLLHVEWKDLKLEKSYGFGKIFATQLRWVSEHVGRGEKVMVGIGFSSNAFYFKQGLRATIVEWPKVSSLAELKRYVKDYGINYGLLDLATVAYNMDVYGDYFRVGPDIGLELVRELPPPFHRIPRGPGLPPLYEIYEITS